MSNKYARNVDLNQAEIVAGLREQDIQVVLMHTVGAGFPDLICARNGQAWFVEVKGSKGRLTPAQKRFHSEWRGPKILVVRSLSEALEVIG